MTNDELYDLLERHPKAFTTLDRLLLRGLAGGTLGDGTPIRLFPWATEAMMRGLLVAEAERRGMWAACDDAGPKQHWSVWRRVGFNIDLTNAEGPTIIAALLAALEDA